MLRASVKRFASVLLAFAGSNKRGLNPYKLARIGLDIHGSADVELGQNSDDEDDG